MSSPWLDQDIGNPSIAGDASGTSAAMTVTAGGEDVWGTSDEFHFVYQQVTGDVDIRARVDKITQASTWSKAGVMIRASLDPSAAHGFALVSSAKGVAFQRRTVDGGLSTHTSGPYAAPPRWVRLVRSGTTLTAYTSADGSTWTTIDSDTIALGDSAYVGIAVTSHNAGAATTASLSQVSVTPVEALPSGQSNADIGSPSLKGSTSYSSGVYTIKAAGRDIWDSSDQFQYVYQPVSGDIDVSVRVASVSYANAWSKAGVMIRASLSAKSAHAYALASAGRGYAFQRRAVAGGLSDHTSGSSGAPPGWVRLKRSGDMFTAYQSTDGKSWTVIGSDSISMPDAVYVGIAVTSHNTSAYTTAKVDHFSVTTASPTNQPPTVTLTAPANGTSYAAPASIALTASASDPENQLSKVEFYSGSTRLATDTSAPYSFTWSSVAAGTYTLTAKAYDASGLSATSSAATVTVGATNKPPTVSLTAPASGASFTAPASITLTASASDPEGKLAKVEFYSGSTLLATDTASPFTFTWSSVAAGTYTLTARAYDTAGASATSAAVSISVTAAASIPTGVTFQASADHATLVTSYQLLVFAAGANPSTATPVSTYNAGKPTPNSSNDITVSAPSFFSALAPGNYQLVVAAVGSAGTSQSTAVAFTR